MIWAANFIQTQEFTCSSQTTIGDGDGVGGDDDDDNMARSRDEVNLPTSRDPQYRGTQKNTAQLSYGCHKKMLSVAKVYATGLQVILPHFLQAFAKTTQVLIDWIDAPPSHPYQDSQGDLTFSTIGFDFVF